MAGAISKSNSGGVTTATSIPTSWAAGSATSGRDLCLFIESSNIISGTPAGWTQRASAVNNADVKLYTRVADGTATDTPTVAVGSCGARWLLIELSGTSGFDAVGSTQLSPGNQAPTQSLPVTPTSGARYLLAFNSSQNGSAFTWTNAASLTWTNSFVDAGLQTRQNGSGGVNDAAQINLATLSVTASGAAFSTVGTSTDVAQQLGVAIAFAESASGSSGSATGTGTATGLSGSIGAASGVGTATGKSGSIGAATGLGTATGRSGSIGAATGAGAATGLAGSIGAASGVGTATGLSAAVSTGQGVATGTGTASGFSGALGSAAGVGTAQGLAGSLGAATGTGSAAGFSGAKGAASGAGTATGLAGSAGQATGLGAATGLAGSIGSATGTGTAAGFPVVAADSGQGVATGTGTATGYSGSQGQASGLGTARGYSTPSSANWSGTSRKTPSLRWRRITDRELAALALQAALDRQDRSRAPAMVSPAVSPADTAPSLSAPLATRFEQRLVEARQRVAAEAAAARATARAEADAADAEQVANAAAIEAAQIAADDEAAILLLLV